MKDLNVLLLPFSRYWQEYLNYIIFTEKGIMLHILWLYDLIKTIL